MYSKILNGIHATGICACVVKLMNVTPHLNGIVIGLIPDSILKFIQQIFWQFCNALANKCGKSCTRCAHKHTQTPHLYLYITHNSVEEMCMC